MSFWAGKPPAGRPAAAAVLDMRAFDAALYGSIMVPLFSRRFRGGPVTGWVKTCWNGGADGWLSVASSSRSSTDIERERERERDGEVVTLAFEFETAVVSGAVPFVLTCTGGVRRAGERPRASCRWGYTA